MVLDTVSPHLPLSTPRVRACCRVVVCVCGGGGDGRPACRVYCVCFARVCVLEGGVLAYRVAVDMDVAVGMYVSLGLNYQCVSGGYVTFRDSRLDPYVRVRWR